ncbi:6-phospho-beta-glucosidase [Xylanibacillus composti]|uniref:Putative 6-phospho-beta-glucosidase n=1 Tax=Xylanibacillus composti TaxID=1572762 RepID=A0A8J4M2D0_9BACL|nr:6-phospho-beta-glucosidase [Xylanibacillus composti]MDT9726058.1 6-phospho-beta-glucosidase [Xylanibacillus composti]GIQ68797.1 putative 6-phospho-beta-glucosidase [Xylanibacillus composti]
MKKPIKVAVIGGGSSYTPELIDGFIRRYAELPIQELVLVDIEEGSDKLRTIGELAGRMIQKAGAPIQLSTTLDRREAIRNADFVLTQIRVGMLEARSRDEKIPLKYGCIGQETTGAGGFAKALRTIPVILDICREIEELSPNAFLINFTNPAGIITEAVLKHAKVKTIGLCNLPIHTRMQTAKLMEVAPEEVQIEMAGINHLNWTTRIMIGGEDRTKEVIALHDRSDGLAVKNIPDHKWGEGFLASLQMLPCSYLKYYYLKDKMLQDQLEDLSGKGTRADAVRKVEDELFQLYADPELDHKPAQLEQRGGAYYSEAAVDLIASIYNNKRDVQIVNVRNDGILASLPDDAAIEVPCVISAAGAKPIALTEQLPLAATGLLQVVKAYEQLTVHAGVTGCYDSAWQALTIHPLVGASSLAKAILDDILQDNKAYLPQF